MIRFVPTGADVINPILSLRRYEPLCRQCIHIFQEALIFSDACVDGDVHENLPTDEDRCSVCASGCGDAGFMEEGVNFWRKVVNRRCRQRARDVRAIRKEERRRIAVPAQPDVERRPRYTCARGRQLISAVRSDLATTVAALPLG